MRVALRRAYSLRARVAAAAALVATIIVIVLGMVAGQMIRHNNVSQIDRQLEAAAAFVRFRPEIAIRVLSVVDDRTNRRFAATLYQDRSPVVTTATVLPLEPVGAHTVTADGVTFRMLSVADSGRPGRVMSFGMPVRSADHLTTEQRRWVLAAGAISIAAAAGLGWLLGGRAVRPIVELTERVRAGPPRPLPTGGRSGVREADELADAVDDMLRQISDAQAESASSLAAARDFAAASAHELRTPLTAMRTDIEVLRTLELDATQRREILADLHRAQGRVEATLTALERLATGELTSDRDYTDTDIAELCDLAAADAMRHNAGLTVRIDTDPELVVRGLPAGLRLAIDNALANSVRHGNAHTIELSAHRSPDGGAVVMVDDDGAGVPSAERTAVFARFARGSNAAKGGSGLGLALIAQQAQLHGGRAFFEDSPLGGARLILEIRGRPQSHSLNESPRGNTKDGVEVGHSGA